MFVRESSVTQVVLPNYSDELHDLDDELPREDCVARVKWCADQRLLCIGRAAALR